eukprot:CAMPEP_0197651992 /NCGR_PEP_ID=MMETSP1338-20131121/34178_1 /TAXON_ID=43686 ORGANISM="Pelagodinium beii, Strain RCC1491" /NCGR_SAMPLE_ID=MMETSP1338 /ASSEMBLY_ACC=CAM_ASM_000754 /LENGTH=345 /DNA_ID=CAMNT_0043226771 /DNA_START=53 /DNA_END=1090 /DNA_ORIENTATION=-
MAQSGAPAYYGADGHGLDIHAASSFAPLAPAVPQYGALDLAKGKGKGKAVKYTASQKAAMSPAERFRVEQEEKQQADFERRERVRRKNEKQGNRDRRNFINRMVFSQVFFAVCLGVLMTTSRWCTNLFTGPGIGTITVSASLLEITVDVDCTSNWLESAACKKTFINIKGTTNLFKSQGQACALIPSTCQVLSRLYASNLALIAFFSGAILSLLFAAFFLYSYAFTSAHPKLRQSANVLVWLGPILAAGGMLLWTLLTPDLAEIPSSLTNLGSMLGLGALAEFRGVHSWQYGRSWFGALTVCILLMIQGVFWQTFFERSNNEDDIIWEEVRQKAYIEGMRIDDKA